MKTHPASEPGRARGPAPGLSTVPHLAWCLLIACTAFYLGPRALAQSFIPVIDKAVPAEDNTTFPDHEGDYPAYIVIKNIGVITASLSNWALTDDPAVPRKWIFPSPAAGIPLAENQTLVVFASAKNRLTPPYATNFLLPCGSTVYLNNPQGSTNSQKAVEGSSCRPCVSFFNSDTLSAWTVPTAAFPPSDWKLPSYTGATSWSRGGRCLGYESDPINDNMILYASFDAADVVNTSTTRTIADISGPFLHTGSWLAPTFSPNIGIPITTPAQILQSVQFTGPTNPSSYAFWNHHAELEPATGSYSFSIWVRPTNTDPQQNEVIFRKGANSAASTTPGYVLTRNRLTGGSFSIVHGGGAFTTTFTNVIPANQWTHLMVVIDRGKNNLAIYRNGTLVAQQDLPAGGITVTAPNQQLVLAQANTLAGMFQGFMDDFITWGRLLPAADVTRVYNTGLAGKRVIDPGGPGAPAALYSGLIQTNVQTAMKGVNTSIYERIQFNVANATLVSALKLRVNYDDGFIAWINGTEVARRNAPSGVPLWNSAALTDRADASALVTEEIDISAAGLPAIVTGSANVLAIQGLNATATDARFLLCPDLCYEQTRPEDCFVTTSGRNFWITFPGNFPDESTNPLNLSVTITGAAGTVGNVSIPGLSVPFSQNFALPAGGKMDINLPKEASLDKSDTIEKKGVHIIASQNVAVYGRTRIDFSTDTFLAHQYKCLGSEYIVLAWGNSWVGYPELNGTQFGIVATADNTHVSIRPKATTGGHTAGVAYNIVLNQGQTYLLRNTASGTADLTGTEIISDSAVAVFGGHRNANIQGQTFFANTVVEQQLPVPFWTTEYCTAPFRTRLAPGDTIRVLGSQSATNLFRNGVAIGSVNRGEFKDVLTIAGSVITANKPILTAHFSASFDADDVEKSDPFQINAQPTSSWLNGYKFSTPAAGPPLIPEFPDNYCNIIARAADIGGIVFAPAAVAMGPVTAINATYSYRQVTLAPSTTYAVTGNSFGIEIYGYDKWDSYGHTGGMGFADRMPPTFVQCPPDITIFTTQVVGAGERATLPNLGSQFGVIDNCCPSQGISINQTPKEGTLLPVGDYQVVITASDCAQNQITCATTVHVRTDPRAAAFPTAFGNPALEATVWGWDADPDNDGLSNDDEYAAGTDMTKPSAIGDAFTFKRVMRDGHLVAEISYRRRLNDPSLEYILEGSNDTGGWFGGLGHFEDISQVPDALAGFNRVTVWSVDSGIYDRFFVRLRFRRN